MALLRFIAYACLLLGLPSSVAQLSPDPQPGPASGYDYGFDILARSQTPSGPIVVGNLVDMAFAAANMTGAAAPPANGTVPPVRREIRELKVDSISWNLYILGLDMLQWRDQKDELSFYQLAGIHGLPYTSWNGVEAIPGSEESGYCTHSSVLFGTWHRPYLALFEQIMYDRVNLIASKFSDDDERAAYQSAASTFRLPFWDWALAPEIGGTVFVQEFTLPTIDIYGPAGWQVIANPLYSYHFRPLDRAAFINAGLNVWNETLRAPTNATAPTAVSQNSLIVSAMSQGQSLYQQRLYALLSSYHKFDAFSTKRWGEHLNETYGRFDSCESIHDSVHMTVGQGGHFEYIEYSAFDPIFFLHHVMIDRVVALWQALNPDEWIYPLTAEETTFTTAQGQVQDASTPLTPFRSDPDGGFWTSDMSRDLTVFGYTYDDLYLDVANHTQRRDLLVAAINTRYGGSSPFGFINRFSPEQDGSGQEQSQEQQQQQQKRAAASAAAMQATDWENEPNLSATFGPVPPPPRSVIIPDGHYTEWVINVRVLNQALGGSFSIHFFVGRVPADPAVFRTAPNLVGTASIFTMMPRPGMPVHNIRVSSAVPLTAALMRLISAGRLRSLRPAEVTPFLERKLEYRVVDRIGRVVSPTAALELSISVACATVKAPSSNHELPKWGPQRRQFQLAGGASD